MSFREKIRDRALPHLPPGETYRVSFMAEHTLWNIQGLLPRYRVIVVTDRLVHVYKARLWRSCDPGARIGSWAQGAFLYKGRKFLSHEIHIGNQPYWVRRPFQDLLQEALAVCHQREDNTARRRSPAI